MNDLCIRDLAHVVRGRLRLADMPPLGGEWEPIQRIVLDLEQVGPGDVAVLGGQDAETNLTTAPGDSGWVEEAYLRGALGIVTAGRPIEPWAGRFSVNVKNTKLAVRRLAAWARRRFNGMLTIVLESQAHTPIGPTIDQHLCRDGFVKGSWTMATEWLDVASALLRLSTRDRYAIISVTGKKRSVIAACADLFAPHVAVMTQQSCGRPGLSAAESAIVAALPDHGWVVVPADRPIAESPMPQEQWVRVMPGELVATVGSLMSGWGANSEDLPETPNTSGEWSLFTDAVNSWDAREHRFLTQRRKK